MQDLDIIEISDEEAQNAKVLASAMSDARIRKRAMIDILGINCAIDYLQSQRIRTDTRRSAYKIPALFEEFGISDIYYANNRIDVITLYKEKTIKIPKSHLDIDILPNYYFIVQIGTKIKEAKMIGFIDAKNIRNCSSDSKYCYPTLDMIMNIDDFIKCTKSTRPQRIPAGKHIDCMGLYLKFIDNDLSSTYKKQLIQHLMNCDSCRASFIDTIEFEKAAGNVRKFPSLVEKYEPDGMFAAMAADMTQQSSDTFEEAAKNVSLERIYGAGNELADLQREASGENFEQSKGLDDKFEAGRKFVNRILSELSKVENFKNMNAKNRRAVIAIACAFIVLILFALISLQGTSNLKEEDVAAIEENSQPQLLYDENEEYYPEHEARLIKKERSYDEYAMQPVPEGSAYSPSVSNISWEAPESIVKKGGYTKYLQLAGKNVKLNLQNELLLVSDIPTNRHVEVDIKLTSSGELISITVAKTSGSYAIDKAIEKVTTDTIKYMKPPSQGLVGKPIEMTLDVDLN